jgi:hypothetical protein
VRFSSSSAYRTYSFETKEISAAEWSVHRERLTRLRPDGTPGLRMWSEVDGRYLMGVGYGLQHFGRPRSDLRWVGAPIPAERTKFHGTFYTALHESAVAAMRLRVASLDCGGVMCIPFGAGRSVVICAHIAIHGVRAVVFCAPALMDHVAGEVRRMLPLIRVSCIRRRVGGLTAEDLIAVGDCDVLIVCSTLRARDVERLTPAMSGFGAAYIDEIDMLAQRSAAAILSWPIRVWFGISCGGGTADPAYACRLQAVIGSCIFDGEGEGERYEARPAAAASGHSAAVAHAAK